MIYDKNEVLPCFENFFVSNICWIFSSLNEGRFREEFREMIRITCGIVCWVERACSSSKFWNKPTSLSSLWTKKSFFEFVFISISFTLVSKWDFLFEFSLNFQLYHVCYQLDYWLLFVNLQPLRKRKQLKLFLEKKFSIKTNSFL